MVQWGSIPEPQHCSIRSDGTHCPAAPFKISWELLSPLDRLFSGRELGHCQRGHIVYQLHSDAVPLPTIHPVKSGIPRLCDTEGVKPSDLFRVHSRLCCAGLEGQVSLKRQNSPAGNRNAVISAATQELGPPSWHVSI